MGLIWTPGQREIQSRAGARIDTGNPLTRGLAFVLDGGQVLPVTRQSLTVGGTVAAVVTPAGVAHRFATSYFFSSQVPVTAAPLTFAAVGRVSAYSSGGTLIAIANSISSDNYFQLGLNTDGTIRAVARAGSFISANTSGGVTLNKIFCAAAIYVSATERYAWLDGILSSVESTSSTPTGLNRVSFGVLGRDSLADYLAGDELIGCIWTRALAEGELRDFRRDPSQIYEPENDPVFYSLAAGGTTVAVPAGALTLTGYAPTVSFTAHQTIAVPAGALTLTGFAPTVSTSASQTIAVPAASLTLTGFAPTVAATANQSISVPAGSLTLTGYAPTVYTTAVTTIAVPAGTLTLTGYAPTVSYTTHAYIGVPAGALTLTGYAPTVLGGTSSIWTPASASSGTWTPASASGGTWTPQ